MRETEKLEMLGEEKLGLNFLTTRANLIQSKCDDFNVKSEIGKVRVNDDLSITFADENGGIYTKGLSQHSLSQLCGKLEVPTRYINKCINNGRVDLAVENINDWLQDYNKNFLFRVYNEKLRGVLSDKYSVLDTHEILDGLQNIIDPDEYKVKSFILNEERFHTRLVQHKNLDIPNEDLFAGITIDSSDVGRNTLQVQFFIYKQVCTNGLILSKGGGMLFQQKHIGISKEDFTQGLQSSLEVIPNLIENAETLVKRSIKDKDFANYLGEQKEILKQQADMSDNSINKIIDLMQYKYGNTRWGFINGITEVAQDYTLERRLQLEEMAGRFLIVA